MNSALAMQEAYRRGRRRGADEEPSRRDRRCAMSKHFLVTAARWTPPITAGLLAGVTRAFVLELAAKTGIPRVRADAARGRPRVADRCFPSTNAREIVPVVRVDDHVVGHWQAGSGDAAPPRRLRRGSALPSRRPVMASAGRSIGRRAPSAPAVRNAGGGASSAPAGDPAEEVEAVPALDDPLAFTWHIAKP